MQLYLDFHHNTFLARSSVETILQSLKDEFDFFAEESVARIDWNLSIKNQELLPMSPVVAHKITEIFAQDEDRLNE